jgi:hypothetical protein
VLITRLLWSEVTSERQSDDPLPLVSIQMILVGLGRSSQKFKRWGEGANSAKNTNRQRVGELPCARPRGIDPGYVSPLFIVLAGPHRTLSLTISSDINYGVEFLPAPLCSLFNLSSTSQAAQQDKKDVDQGEGRNWHANLQ